VTYSFFLGEGTTTFGFVIDFLELDCCFRSELGFLAGGEAFNDFLTSLSRLWEVILCRIKLLLISILVYYSLAGEA